MAEVDTKKLRALTASIKKNAGELLKDLQALKDVAPFPALQQNIDWVETNAVNWLPKRLETLAVAGTDAEVPTATPAGLERRRKALAKAKADKNEAEVTRLEGEIAVLSGKERADG